MDYRGPKIHKPNAPQLLTCLAGLLFIALLMTGIYILYDKRKDEIDEETDALSEKYWRDRAAATSKEASDFNKRLSEKLEAGQGDLQTSSSELAAVRAEVTAHLAKIQSLETSLAETTKSLTSASTEAAAAENLRTNIAVTKAELEKQKIEFENLMTRYNALVSGRTEVFLMAGDKDMTRSEAADLCKASGFELASSAQLHNAYGQGAEWCRYAHTKDHNGFAMQVGRHWCANNGIWGGSDPMSKGAAHCIGIKPIKGANPKVTTPFNAQKWSQYDVAVPLPTTEFSGIATDGHRTGSISNPIMTFGNVDSNTTCVAECQNFPACLAAVYNSKSKVCALHNNVDAKPTLNPDATTTIRKFNSIPFHPTKSTDTKINDTPENTLWDISNVKSVDDCEALCSAVHGGSAYNYDTNTKTCSVKRGGIANLTTTAAPGIISNKRVNW